MSGTHIPSKLSFPRSWRRITDHRSANGDRSRAFSRRRAAVLRGFDDEEGEPVGRIDHILLAPDTVPLRWCAVELQAVYFSGKGMKSQFDILQGWNGPGLPWPNEVRRPDFRSSGPKRLMPQLQTKVPTLRRWGKKMAVVTDRAFFESMGEMEEVPDVSNCDIVWFVLDFVPSASGFELRPHGKPHHITLERAIEGLIAGEPVSLDEFERRISAKLAKKVKLLPSKTK